MENGNTSAFPETSVRYDEYGKPLESYIIGGLTKREHFAGLAMQGLLSQSPVHLHGNKEGQCVPSELCKEAIEYADKLLHQLSLSEGKK